MKSTKMLVQALRSLFLLGLACACGRDVATGRRCAGRETCIVPEAGRGGASGFGSSGAGGAGGDAVVENALHVQVEDREAIRIEIITIACAGECADVEAVASGGNPPYAFEWEDGSSEPARRVCPDVSTEYAVTATDTAFVDDEFAYARQTARAEVTATVLDCPEADAGPVSGACIENPSFEGAVTPSQLEAFDATPWNACYAGGLTYSAIGNATLWPLQNWTFPEASDGATYLALGQQLVFLGLASQALCVPIEGGAVRSFTIDLARAISTDPAAEAAEQRVEILGGTVECEESEVLWTSPLLTTHWTTQCVTLTPSRDIRTLAFRPAGSGGGLMEALIDNIVPVERCD